MVLQYNYKYLYLTNFITIATYIFIIKVNFTLYLE